MEKFLPLIRPMVLKMTKDDIQNDADFMEVIRDIPQSLDGMALGKYDDAIRIGRKLLDRVYLAKEDTKQADEIHAEKTQ